MSDTSSNMFCQLHSSLADDLPTSQGDLLLSHICDLMIVWFRRWFTARCGVSLCALGHLRKVSASRVVYKIISPDGAQIY